MFWVVKRGEVDGGLWAMGRGHLEDFLCSGRGDWEAVVCEKNGGEVDEVVEAYCRFVVELVAGVGPAEAIELMVEGAGDVGIFGVGVVRSVERPGGLGGDEIG